MLTCPQGLLTSYVGPSRVEKASAGAIDMPETPTSGAERRRPVRQPPREHREIGSACRQRGVTLKDTVGMLQFADVADDFLNFIGRNAGDGRHVAERPVVLPHSLTDGGTNTEIGVMPRLVDFVDKRWTLPSPGSMHAVAK